MVCGINGLYNWIKFSEVRGMRITVIDSLKVLVFPVRFIEYLDCANELMRPSLFSNGNGYKQLSFLIL